MFLSDYAEFTQVSFSTPVPNLTGWRNNLFKTASSPVGKLFFKDAQHITRLLPDGTKKITYGIAQSGKSLRKSPFLVAGGAATLYGGYRAKKTYDKYKPEIKTGLKLAKAYDSFKNKFNWSND